MLYSIALSCLSLWNPWTVACPAPLSMEFSRQEYRSGLPFPTLGDLPNPGIKSKSLVSFALAGRFFTTVPHGKPISRYGWGYVTVTNYPQALSAYTIGVLTHSTYSVLWWSWRSFFVEEEAGDGGVEYLSLLISPGTRLKEIQLTCSWTIWSLWSKSTK